MPDLIESNPRIIVHNRRGEALPYSRGIMATSLLATGIPTEEAYRLASIIQARLLNLEHREVTADELVQTARLTLDDDALDSGTTIRWLAWRSAKRSGTGRRWPIGPLGDDSKAMRGPSSRIGEAVSDGLDQPGVLQSFAQVT